MGAGMTVFFQLHSVPWAIWTRCEIKSNHWTWSACSLRQPVFLFPFSYFAISKSNTGNSFPYVCETFLLVHLFRIDPSSCLPDEVFQGFLILATFRISSRFWDATYANPSFRFMPPLFFSFTNLTSVFSSQRWLAATSRPGLRFTVALAAKPIAFH